MLPLDRASQTPLRGGFPMVLTTLWHRTPPQRIAAHHRTAGGIPLRRRHMGSPMARGQGRRRRLCAAVLVLPRRVLHLTPRRGVATPAQSMLFALTAAQSTCLPYATGRVTISALGPGETRQVEVSGLPPHTEFHREPTSQSADPDHAVRPSYAGLCQDGTPARSRAWALPPSLGRRATPVIWHHHLGDIYERSL